MVINIGYGSTLSGSMQLFLIDLRLLDDREQGALRQIALVHGSHCHLPGSPVLEDLMRTPDPVGPKAVPAEYPNDGTRR